MSGQDEKQKHYYSEKFGLPLKKRIDAAARRVVKAAREFGEFMRKPGTKMQADITRRVNLIINRLKRFTTAVQEKAKGRWQSLKETWTNRPICFVFAILSFVIGVLIQKAANLGVRHALRMCFSALFGVRAELLRGVTDAFVDYGFFFFFNGLIYKYTKRVDRKIHDDKDATGEKKVFDVMNSKMVHLREQVVHVAHHPKEATKEMVEHLKRSFDDIRDKLREVGVSVSAASSPKKV
jgi:hypothetical protein